MECYDPAIAPKPITWLAMSTEEKLILVLSYYHQHSDVGFIGGGITSHSSIYVLIENQLAENIQLIPETLMALMQLDMPREKAIGAIGSIVLEGTKADVEFTSEQYKQKFQDMIFAYIQAG